MKKALKVVLINLMVFIFLWAILELISFKIYQDIPENYRNGKRIVEANLNRNFPKTEQSILSHPYLLYVNNPDYFDSVKQHNSLGYRSPEFSIEKDSNTIRVLALGGSTTYGYLNRNPKSTWPARLQEEL
ncbi:MAG TPA: hypothetical protein VFO70_10365, partial [Chitinophagaceae bacterium]|nr:hypothetical protein [Chitinophagaceae bacterium]